MLLTLLAFAQIGMARANATKTVLLLYDGGREFSGIAMIDRNFESTLNDVVSNRVTIFREYMDLTRIRQTNYEPVLRDFYRFKYANSKPDVIVAVRDRPLDFLLKPGGDLFPGVPIVSSAMDLRQVKSRKLPATVTGVSLPLTFWPSLAVARQLQPEIENVAVVSGASPNDHALEMLARNELREHEKELNFTYLSGLSMEELLHRVGKLPPHSVILFVLVTQDGDGRSFMPHDVIAKLSAAANAPVYIFADNWLDCGAIGGDLISAAECGKETARLTLRILHGENPASIPFVDSPARVKMLDARELQRWNIRSANIPPGTIVLHRELTVWEAYRWRILGGITLIILQSILIVALLLHRKRRRMAEENLRISEAQRKAAVLEERNRMARDIHDTLAQGFTGVIFQLEAAKNASVNGAPSEADEHMQRASELARQSPGEARRSVKALRPEALEQGELCAALRGLIQQTTTGTSLRGEFTTQGQPRKLSPIGEDTLLRILQECLTNALKHSGAKVFRATLSFDAKAVSLKLEDDGIGFDPLRRHDGFGLLGIRERVNQTEGELVIATEPGNGTRICVTLITSELDATTQGQS